MSDIDDPNDSLKKIAPGPGATGPWRLTRVTVTGATQLHFTGPASFDDCFEVVFDPFLNAPLWLDRRKVASMGNQVIYRCSVEAKFFLRALLRGLVGGGRNIGVGDVEGCAREQFDHLVAAGLFTDRGGRMQTSCKPGDLDHEIQRWTTTTAYKNSAWARHTGPQATLGAAMRHASAVHLSTTKPGGPIQAIMDAAKIAEQVVDSEIVEAVTLNCLPDHRLAGLAAAARQDNKPIGILSSSKAEAPVFRALCYLCDRRPVINAGAVCSTCRDAHLTPSQEA